MVEQLGADASYFGMLQSSVGALQLVGGLLSGEASLLSDTALFVFCCRVKCQMGWCLLWQCRAMSAIALMAIWLPT